MASEQAASAESGRPSAGPPTEMPHLADRTIVFRTGPAEWATTAHLVGEFNDWRTDAAPMNKVFNRFELPVDLPAGRKYRYKFLFDGEHWENDPSADEYTANVFGGEDSVRRV